MDLNYRDFTEEEKRDLLSKFKNIGKLFGINLTVVERCSYISGAMPLIQTIRLSLNPDKYRHICDSPIKEMTIKIINNIDTFHSELDFAAYALEPSMIIMFMHELSHILTMELRDFEKCNSLEYRKYLRNNDIYRLHPYEKLADNLGYELLYENHENIYKILSGEDVEVTQEQINKNMMIAEEFKNKYVGGRK